MLAPSFLPANKHCDTKPAWQFTRDNIKEKSPLLLKDGELLRGVGMDTQLGNQTAIRSHDVAFIDSGKFDLPAFIERLVSLEISTLGKSKRSRASSFKSSRKSVNKGEPLSGLRTTLFQGGIG